jgi:hypothetical protein
MRSDLEPECDGKLLGQFREYVDSDFHPAASLIPYEGSVLVSHRHRPDDVQITLLGGCIGNSPRRQEGARMGYQNSVDGDGSNSSPVCLPIIGDCRSGPFYSR